MVTFTLDWVLVIQLLVSTVLPLLVGLVTKVATDGGVKAVILACLSLVTSLLAELGNALAEGTPYDLGVGLILALPTFIIAVSTYYGILKPTGIALKVQQIGDSEHHGR